MNRHEQPLGQAEQDIWAATGAVAHSTAPIVKGADVTTIDRICSPSPAVFIREYLAKSRPVIITGMANQWAAASRWTPEYFRTAFSGIKLIYEAYEGDEVANDPLEYVRSDETGLWRMYRVETTLREFIDRMLLSEPTRKFYCSNWALFDAIPQLRSDVGELDDYMGWLGHVPARARRKLQLRPGLWMGPKGTLSMLHFDRANNLYTQIYGRKKYVMISPEYSKNVYSLSPEIASSKLFYSPVNAEAPDPRRFPLYSSAPRIEFIIEPGEILFIPTGWWHHVRALEPALSLSMPWVQPVDHLIRLRSYYLELAQRRVRQRIWPSARAPFGQGATPQ